jgi:hypothetical protein
MQKMRCADGGGLYSGREEQSSPGHALGRRSAGAVVLERHKDYRKGATRNHHVSLPRLRLPGVVCDGDCHLIHGRRPSPIAVERWMLVVRVWFHPQSSILHPRRFGALRHPQNPGGPQPDRPPARAPKDKPSAPPFFAAYPDGKRQTHFVFPHPQCKPEKRLPWLETVADNRCKKLLATTLGLR